MKKVLVYLLVVVISMSAFSMTADARSRSRRDKTSSSQTYTVVEPVKPDAPNVTNDDVLNTVTGMKTGMEYKLDKVGYVLYVADTFEKIDFSGNHTLKVRVAKEGINPAGKVTRLKFTTNPVVEEPVVEQPVVEEPVVEEPVVEQPVLEEPVIELPVIDEPVVEEPVEEQPVSNVEGLSILDFGAHSIDEAGYESFDSTSAIQTALNEGGLIDFGSGVYNVSRQLLISNDTIITSEGATINKMFNVAGGTSLFSGMASKPKNITVQNITLNLKGSSSVNDENTSGFSFKSATTNLTIQNVIFLNAGAGAVVVSQEYYTGIDTSKNINFLNNQVYTNENPQGPIFMLMSVDGFRVSGNYVTRGKGQVWLSFTVNGSITNNTLEKIDNYWSYEAHLGGIELYNGCDNVLVDSNILSSNGVINEPFIVGIRSKNNSNITISNNQIEWSNIATEAINVRKDETYYLNTYNHYVTGNVITGTSEEGIKVVSVLEDSIIDNVYIENNTLVNSGITLHGTSVRTNVAYNHIYIRNNTAASISSWKFANSDCEITGNTVYASGSSGICARDMVNSIVSNNTIINTDGTLVYGIDYSYSSFMDIGNNVFVDVEDEYKGYNSSDINFLR